MRDERASLFNYIFLAAMGDTPDAPALSADALWSLRRWPVDLVDWPVDNLQRYELKN